MAYYDEKLQVLREQVARKKRVAAKLGELELQRKKLAEKEEYLRGIMQSEQADVDKLECGSLASFFYNVIGKMDEKLTKEREEAYAARVKHDTAMSELRLIEMDVASLSAEYDELKNCERELEQVMQEKKQAIKASGSQVGEEILRLETEIHNYGAQLRELDEAIREGQLAADIARGISAELDDAEGWSTFDLLGGGLVADIAKHSHLDEAQRQVTALQNALRRFKTELADVSIDADMKVNIDGFLGFADFFFDGLFADWAVMDRITTAQAQVANTRDKINDTLAQLRRMAKEAEKNEHTANKKLQAIITETII